MLFRLVTARWRSRLRLQYFTRRQRQTLCLSYLLSLFLVGLLLLPAPAFAQAIDSASPPSVTPESELIQPKQRPDIQPLPKTSDTFLKSSEPVKTYFLSVPPGGVKHQIAISPAATQLQVTSESGSTATPCGDAVQMYSCTAGKPVKIQRSAEDAIATFMARNSSEQPVRLRLDVYETVTDQP
ncbi:MAG: hypothetical protein ACTS2F_07235 [Thainema sp.]